MTNLPENLRNSLDWRAALDQHDRWLRTVVYTRLRDRDAVDEVMQELALAVVANPPRLRDREKTAPWLYRVAVRQALLHRRRSGRSAKLERKVVEKDGFVEPESIDPLDWLIADERRQMVRDAVESLPPRDAQMIVLKYSEGWTYGQIAEHLGATPGAVESRLHRARKQLRSQLAKQGVLESMR
ncbi:MAG: RNA polymerase sigma factor [Pirellulaceae bacterium]|jgi:RNA polymerase sigma-70 factor (ECF subfamily)|nr:RNA polymerase sigma factor [Pirellulaceae bacterium]MDP7014437.1 RNA polymerase sigma factor [Pirellulaceae bacterium]